MKSRRQLTNGKVELFWRLRDRSQLATRGHRVAPIDLESVPIGIRLSDSPRRLAKLSDEGQSREIPGYSFGSRLMRPTVKSFFAKRCCSPWFNVFSGVAAAVLMHNAVTRQTALSFECARKKDSLGIDNNGSNI